MKKTMCPVYYAIDWCLYGTAERRAITAEQRAIQDNIRMLTSKWGDPLQISPGRIQVWAKRNNCPNHYPDAPPLPDRTIEKLKRLNRRIK